MGFYQLALFPRFWLKALEKWNLTVDLHTALKGPPACLLPSVAGLSCILSRCASKPFWFLFCVFSFCFQFHTAGRTNYRREARLPPARLKPDTGVLLQRSDQERQKWDTGAQISTVAESKPLSGAHICLMNDNIEKKLVASFFFFFKLMGPSRHTIQAVQRKWAH